MEWTAVGDKLRLFGSLLVLADQVKTVANYQQPNDINLHSEHGKSNHPNTAITLNLPTRHPTKQQLESSQ